MHKKVIFWKKNYIDIELKFDKINLILLWWIYQQLLKTFIS